MTPYYQDDLITIYHGDCRDGMPEADIVITDPPYGIAYRSSRNETVINDDDFSVTSEAAALFRYVPTVMFASHRTLHRTLALLAHHNEVRVGVWHKSNVNGSAHGGLWWSDVEFFVAGVPSFPRIAKSAVASAPKNIGNPAWQKGTDAYSHPTQKPVSTMRHIIESFPLVRTILDPFMGSGSTLVAAKQTGRHAIGIEIDERYCERAANRCSQEVLGWSA